MWISVMNAKDISKIHFKKKKKSYGQPKIDYMLHSKNCFDFFIMLGDIFPETK